VVPLLACYWN